MQCHEVDEDNTVLYESLQNLILQNSLWLESSVISSGKGNFTVDVAPVRESELSFASYLIELLSFASYLIELFGQDISRSTVVCQPLPPPLARTCFEDCLDSGTM